MVIMRLTSCDHCDSCSQLDLLRTEAHFVSSLSPTSCLNTDDLAKKKFPAVYKRLRTKVNCDTFSLSQSKYRCRLVHWLKKKKERPGSQILISDWNISFFTN